MKYLIPLLFLSGCSTLPAPMDSASATHYMQEASWLSGRTAVPAPKVYVIPDWAVYQKLVCGHSCGLGITTAVYKPAEDRILINGSIVKADRLEGVLVHELVHYMQRQQHDKRSCIDREYEAYKAQFNSRGKWVSPVTYEYALASCQISGGV